VKTTCNLAHYSPGSVGPGIIPMIATQMKNNTKMPNKGLKMQNKTLLNNNLIIT
jgi:hypothetical protein